MDVQIKKSIEILKNIINETKSENASKFSETLGLKRPERIYKVMRGQNSISKNLAQLINEKYPQYSIEYLRGGDDAQKEDVPVVTIRKGDSKVLAKSEEGIPYYNVDFAGGWSISELFTNSRPDFSINNPEFRGSDFACNLVGHSVSKVIPSGAIIGLKKVEDWQTYYPTEYLYGIVTKNDLRTVKFAKRIKGDDKHLKLVSCPKNAEAEEEMIPINFITNFFQVVGFAKVERLAM